VTPLIQFYFLSLEIALWTKPKGLKAFGLEKHFGEKTKVLAADQGL
jgi:putative membrane protein